MTTSTEHRIPSAPERHFGGKHDSDGVASADAHRSWAVAILRRTPIAAAVAASLWLRPAALVHAADSVEPAQTIEEVTVTATRRSEGVQEIPVNISVVGSSTIDNLRLDSIEKLTRLVPGVAMIDQGSWNDNRLVMRGLSADSITSTFGASTGGVGQFNGATVATYLGETPLYVSFKLIDIDRVEALIGPQGTLYGAGTLAGAVRYIPKKPNLNQVEGDAQVRTYSEAHSASAGYQGDGALNVPLIEGKLALRGVAGYYSDPGFIDYPLLLRTPGSSNPQPDLNDPAAVAANLYRGKDLNDERTFTSRLSLLYKPFDRLEALLTWAHQRTSTDGRSISTAPLLGLGRYESGMRIPEPAHNGADLWSLELNADLGFAQLVSSSSYTQRKVEFTRDQTDLLLSFQYGYENFPDFVTIAPTTVSRDQYTEELRLVSSGVGPFKWLVGGFYNHSKDNFLYREFVPGFPAFAGIDRPDQLEYYNKFVQKQQENALFGELGYQLTDAWQVTVGARRFSYKQDQSSLVDLPLFSGDPTGISADVLTIAQSQSGSLFKFNTSYRFTPDLMLYGTVSEGYRLGGINAVPPCVLPLTPGVPHVCALPNELTFKPDRTRNHEIGVRSTWLDHRLVVNADVFYVNWRDVHVGSFTVNGNETITVNGATAVSKGLELSFQAALPHQLALLGSYSYSDARLTANVPGLVTDNFGAHDAFNGDRLPGSPQHTASLVLQYSRPLRNDYVLLADYGATFTGNVFTKAGLRANGEKLGGYTLHQASIGVGKGKWRASLYADNIFDKYAYTGTINDPTSLQTVNGFTLRRYQHWVIRPRQAGLQLNVNF